MSKLTYIWTNIHDFSLYWNSTINIATVQTELGSPILQADSLPSEPPGKSNTAGTEGIDMSPLVLLTTQPDCQVFRVGNTDDEEVRHSTV